MKLNVSCVFLQATYYEAGTLDVKVMRHRQAGNQQIESA